MPPFDEAADKRNKQKINKRTARDLEKLRFVTHEDQAIACRNSCELAVTLAYVAFDVSLSACLH